MASFAASELLGRLVRRYPGLMQNCITQQLNFRNTSSCLKEFLCFLRISSSPATTTRNETDFVCEKLMDGVERNSQDFVFLSADNIGFKKKKGYNQ